MGVRPQGGACPKFLFGLSAVPPFSNRTVDASTISSQVISLEWSASRPPAHTSPLV